MVKINAEKRETGVSFDADGTAFISVYAPLKEKVALRVQGADTNIDLYKENYGFWTANTYAIKPGDLYTIEMDGKNGLPDPASLHQPQDVHGPSQAVDINAFEWTDSGWKNITQENYILYELHTGTFSTEGTFEGIEKKLDHLSELGINAIEIMPAVQFPGSRNWGYDGVYPYAVQQSYGGYQGLQKLVNACHAKGIAVVLDVVYNHVGPEGNYFQEFAPYFTNKYCTPWGSAINFDDACCDGVRKYFIENALMWFRDFHIDALRLDAVHAIKDFSPLHILREIKLNVDKLMAATGRIHYLIAETDLNDNRFINPLAQDGYGMNAQWIDEFHHALRISAGGEQTSYYQDFDGIAHLAKAYKDAYVYDGIYSPYRKRTFGVKAVGNEGKQFVVFSQNHDQVGNRMLGERTTAFMNFEMQKLMAGAVLASPYIPLLFMGEEYGETSPFLYFVSHIDKDLCNAVSKGRKAEFAAFHAQGEAPDPADEATFMQSKLQWHLLHTPQHQFMLQYYKALIALRKMEPALNCLDRNALNVTTIIENETILLHRWHSNDHIFCCMNFSKQNRQIQLPLLQGTLAKIFDSADMQWGGQSVAMELLHEHQVSITGESIIMYKAIV